MSDRNDGERKIENGLPSIIDFGKHYNNGAGNFNPVVNVNNSVNAAKAGTRLRSRLYGNKRRRTKSIL